MVLRVLQRPPRHRRTPGFTLMELMVVIVVLGILSAAIVPEMRGTYTDAVLRAGSRELVDVCALASSRAVALQREHRVHLDPRTGRYRLEKRVRSPESAPVFLPVRDIPDTEGTLDRRLTVRIQPDSPDSPGLRAPRAPSDPSGSSDLSDSSSPPSQPAPAQSLTFHSDGTADRATIILRDPEGFGLGLRMNPVTARIRVVTLDRP